MPFKANADCRHHIPNQKHKVTNWSAYDASLRQRWSLTVWFTDEAIAGWAAEPQITPGGQPWYSNLAIWTGLTLRAVFRLAFRQTEGLVGSIIRLLGLDLAVPDHTTLCRRAETLEVPRSRPRAGTEPLHLLVDSTGLKLCGSGEWLVEKHGTKTRRSWRKLHIGVDAITGQIVAAGLTTNDVDDGSQVGPLLDQMTEPVAERHSQAAIIVPVDCGPEQHCRNRADTARRAPAIHCRARAHGLAESIGLQHACPCRGRNRPVQTCDRRWAALAHGPASGDRGGRRCSRPESHVGTWTPDLRPDCMKRDREGITAPTHLSRATRPATVELQAGLLSLMGVLHPIAISL